MEYFRILSLEYEQQYNQVRWIGTMQYVILTFYGLVSSFSLSGIGQSLPDNPAAADFKWPGQILVGLGLLGLIVGIGLAKSRSMQMRTYRYLEALICEMATLVGDSVPLDRTALRFRELCTGRGRFTFLNTSNVSTYLAIVFGTLVLLVGLAMVYVAKKGMPSADLLAFWVLPALALVVVFGGSGFLVKFFADRERKKVDSEQKTIGEKGGIGHMCGKYGLSNGVEQRGEEAGPGGRT